jgi:hypothetical protein
MLCRARAEAREKAAAHLAAGNMAAAVECYQRCVDITPAMAKQVIEVSSQQLLIITAVVEALCSSQDTCYKLQRFCVLEHCSRAGKQAVWRLIAELVRC